MAQNLKVLGQTSPAATTVTDLYTAPAATSTTVSSLVITNTNASNITFRVSVAIAGAADAASQYIYYDLPLEANDTFIFTGGISLATTDKIRCYASATGVNFTVFGVELT